MPKLLRARPPADDAEEQLVRRMAAARTASFDTVLRSRIIVLSWDGLSTAVIAAELRCHPKTVRERISRFNDDGVESLTERPKVGRKPRLTEGDRRRLITLASAPIEPGDDIQRVVDRPLVGAAVDGRGVRPRPWAITVARWTLDHLVMVAREHGIRVGRSHLRRILREAGFRWERGGFWVAPAAPESGRSAFG
jgi:transposase